MTLIGALREVVGERDLLTDPGVRAPYEHDWTGRFGGNAIAVARPRSATEVAGVLQTCAQHGVSVVPQGGNTGLVGGGVPRGGDVVLSLARLTSMGGVDAALGLVEVGAGTTLAALQRHAATAGLDAGLDFAARDSATIGGIVACDAGGARALRHGTARARVAGLEAVLTDGSTVRRLCRLHKDNAGFNLPALLVGSEGSLGVITRVVWKLVPRLPARVTALIPLPDADSAIDLLASLRARAPSLEACEFMTGDSMQLVLSHQGREPPVARAPMYVLAELAASYDPTDELAAALEQSAIEDAAVADDTTSRERMWSLREGHADAISAAGVPHKLDVGVPLVALPDFLERVPSVARSAAPGARTILFGHLADGNVHVNVLGADLRDGGIDDAVLQFVMSCGGTISAEHGIGIAKARWLTDMRGADEVRSMRAIKASLDPGGILNPGVVLSIGPG